MFKKQFLLFFVLSCFIAPVLGQDDFPSIFAEALRMEEEKFNKLAGEYWLELHEMEPENANINYRLGLSYLNSNKNKLNALKYLKLIPTDKLTNNYDYYDKIELNAPVEAMYYLAHAYHLNNMVDSAIAVYERFSNQISEKHCRAERHPIILGFDQGLHREHINHWMLQFPIEHPAIVVKLSVHLFLP